MGQIDVSKCDNCGKIVEAFIDYKGWIKCENLNRVYTHKTIKNDDGTLRNFVTSFKGYQKHTDSKPIDYDFCGAGCLIEYINSEKGE